MANDLNNPDTNPQSQPEKPFDLKKGFLDREFKIEDGTLHPISVDLFGNTYFVLPPKIYSIRMLLSDLGYNGEWPRIIEHLKETTIDLGQNAPTFFNPFEQNLEEPQAE